MIEVKEISKVYKMGDVELFALKDVSFKIEEGEFVAIMGPSGSGKSTLLNILGCLDVPSSGSYFLDGEDVSKLSNYELAEIRNDRIGFVFQNFNLLSRLTAIGNVELPLIYTGKSERRQRAMRSLDAVNLGERASHRSRELSGGEQQRAAIARALVNEPSLILADEPTGNLDSKSGREIMTLLSDLNNQGITVIVVTHDEFIASHAKRIIRLHDGGIVEDKVISVSDKVGIDVETRDATLSHRLVPTRKRRFSFGEVKESLSMAVSSIFLNKLRSSLTMLGIIVGVACVIVMIALGQGASVQITDRISQMGANLVMVYQFHRMVGGGNIVPLTFEDAQAIAQECPSVARVDASYSRNTQVIYGNKNTNTSVNGVTPNFPEVRNFSVEKGSFFTENDNRLMRRVAVLGKTVVKNLFEGEDPIGEYVKINRVFFQVIGVMNEKGSSGWRDEDDVVFVPLKTAQKRLFGEERDRVMFINIEAKSKSLIDKASKEVASLLRQRHRIKEGDEDDFNIRSQTEILSTVQQTTKTITILLEGIAMVSLIVGGIGIMNIMLVSVTERTREIGIRKAIGAQRRDILGQFLIEAVVLSLSGGVVGIALGSLISWLVSELAGWPTIISPGAVALSFFFAVGVGLFFGFYPAHKASLLNPIEALRYE